MKRQKTLKALVLTAAMAFGMLMPTTMNAQSDEFFRGSDEVMNRESEAISVTGGITNQQFGQETPLGSGLLIMVAAGAGYAMARRKRQK